MSRRIENEVGKNAVTCGVGNTFRCELTATDNQSGSLYEVKPSGILDFFQTSAGIHAEKSGVSAESLIKNGRCWVLESVSFEVINPIPSHSTVITETYYRTPGRLFYERDYVIYDKSGNKSINGTSRWLILDIKTRRPISRAIDYGYPGREEYVMPVHEKIRCDFESAEILGEYKIHLSETDIVGHLNNTHYADVIFEFYPRAVKNMQIDFVKECLYGETITVKSLKSGEDVFIEGSVKGERRFLAKIRI